MEITNFKDMYLSELQELASVEGQLAESLLHMAEVASHPASSECISLSALSAFAACLGSAACLSDREGLNFSAIDSSRCDR